MEFSRVSTRGLLNGPSPWRQKSVDGDGKPQATLLIQFATTGSMDREHSCESFDLLLQTLHEVLAQHASPLSLELGVVNGEVVQAFRTTDKNVLRSLKNALRNVFPTCKLYTLPDDSFTPQKETSTLFADVALRNDLYSIRRWQQLLTQSDPLSTLLGALSVNEHSRCFGHVAITLVPVDQRRMKIHRQAFKNMQRDLFRRHDLLAKLFEFSARARRPSSRLPSWIMARFAGGKDFDQSGNLGSTRHHDRETDVQSASKAKQFVFSSFNPNPRVCSTEQQRTCDKSNSTDFLPTGAVQCSPPREFSIAAPV